MRIVGLVLLFSGCVEFLEDDCDQYVDYLCTCGVDSCEDLRQAFDGSDPAVQEQCRIEQVCFESADADNEETCSIVGTPDEDTCLSD